MGGIWYAVPTFGRDCQRRPKSRAMVRNSCLLPPAAYRQLCAMRAFGSQWTAVSSAAGGPWPGMSFGAPHAPGVPPCL